MKVRWLLVASLFMSMFAIASAASVSAAPGVVTELKTGIYSEGQPYPFIHGTADYKVRAGGGSSLAASIQGAQALRFQKLYFVAYDSTISSYVNVCSFHVSVNGSGGCIADTRAGFSVPAQSSGDSVYIQTGSDPNASTDIAKADF